MLSGWPHRNYELTDDPNHLDKSGRLKPENLDAAKRLKHRRARNRKAPADELEVWAKAAEKRAHARPYPPGIMLEPAGLDDEHWTAPHNDDGLWSLQLADAFGTRSQAVFKTFLAQLEKLTGKSYWDEDAKQWRLDENELSASLAIINASKPRNEIEACQAAQMVAVHLLTMKAGAYAIQHHYDHRSALVVAKLANAFSGQIVAMQSLKGKRQTARQSIKVNRESHHHQHIHVHRGAGENKEQAHEPTDRKPAQIDDDRALVRGQKSGGNVVPLSRDEGQGALLPPRRQIDGRTKG